MLPTDILNLITYQYITFNDFLQYRKSSKEVWNACKTLTYSKQIARINVKYKDLSIKDSRLYNACVMGYIPIVDAILRKAQIHTSNCRYYIMQKILTEEFNHVNLKVYKLLEKHQINNYELNNAIRKVNHYHVIRFDMLYQTGYINKVYLRKIMTKYVKHGYNQDLAKLMKYITIGDGQINYLLCKAYKVGNTQAVKILIDSMINKSCALTNITYNVDDDMYNYVKYSGGTTLFANICNSIKNGDNSYFKKHYNGSDRDIITKIIVKYDNLELFKFINVSTSSFENLKIAIKFSSNEIIRTILNNSIINGKHISFARFLRDVVTKADMSVIKNIVEYLHCYGHMTRNTCERIFVIASEHGYLEVVQYIYDFANKSGYEFSVLYNDKAAFKHALKKNHMHVIKYLATLLK